MKKMLIVAALLMIPALTMAAVTINTAKIIDYGIYTEKTVGTAKLADAPAPTRDLIDNVVFTSITNRIPAQKGVRFGVRFLLDGLPKGKEIVLVKKVLHPAITEKGKTYTAHQYEINYIMGKEFVSGFAFGSDNLIVPGDWTFQFFADGKKVLEQTFTVYKP